MSSVMSPTIADIPIAAQTGTRSGINASSTKIINAVAIPLLQPGWQRMRMGRNDASHLPIEVNEFGNRNVECADEQRQDEQRLGPTEHAGGKHSEELKGLDRKPSDHGVKRDGQQSRQDINYTPPVFGHELRSE